MNVSNVEYRGEPYLGLVTDGAVALIDQWRLLDARL